MPKPVCQQCRREIPGEDVNVAADTVFCRACNFSFALSELTHRAELDPAVDPSRPPEGAWQRPEGRGMITGAKHFSAGKVFPLLGVMLFWNGIVSVFVLVTIGGTLHNLHIPIPAWFPVPSSSSDFADQGPGMTIFLWLFLTPFLGIGMLLAVIFFSSLWGRTEVRVVDGAGMIFTGVSSAGYRRRFDARSVKDIYLKENASVGQNDGPRTKDIIIIEMRDGKRLKFGSLFTEERRKFVAAALRRTLIHPN